MPWTLAFVTSSTGVCLPSRICDESKQTALCTVYLPLGVGTADPGGEEAAEERPWWSRQATGREHALWGRSGGLGPWGARAGGPSGGPRNRREVSFVSCGRGHSLGGTQGRKQQARGSTGGESTTSVSKASCFFWRFRGGVQLLPFPGSGGRPHSLASGSITHHLWDPPTPFPVVLAPPSVSDSDPPASGSKGPWDYCISAFQGPSLNHVYCVPSVE